MIPACFSQPNTISSNSQVPQNLITCTYQTQVCNSPTYLTLTWSKTLFSHSLTLHSPDSFSITISLNPTSFSFFKTKPASKSIHLNHNQKIKLYWDFSHASFTHNSAEPDSTFYIAISHNAKVEFFLGDLSDDFTRRSGLVAPPHQDGGKPIMLSRREHVFGHRNYVSRAYFLGVKHEIGVECNEGTLKVKVDGETRLTVRRLAWKFRGNERIVVGGVEFEFYWDVFNWIDDSKGNTNGTGHGVFVFQVGDGGVWPEMVGSEKRLMRKSLSTSNSGGSVAMAPMVMLSPSLSCSSVLQWAEESSDGGRSSCSSSTTKSSASNNGGFSLLLYAWKKD